MTLLLLHGARDCASSLMLARQALLQTSTTLNTSPGPGQGFLKLCPTSLTVACCTENSWQSARSKPGFWKARVIPSPDSSTRRLKGFQDPSRSYAVQSSAIVSSTMTLASLVSLCSLEGSNGANPGNQSLLWGLSPGLSSLTGGWRGETLAPSLFKGCGSDFREEPLGN